MSLRCRPGGTAKPKRKARPGSDTDLATDALSGNETNEANFDGNVSITQEQDFIAVTANSGVDSGFDKGVIRPSEASDREQMEARKPARPRWKMPRRRSTQMHRSFRLFRLF